VIDAIWGLSALVGIPLLHFVFMRVDLALRDPEKMNQGGIPDCPTVIFQYGSLLLFGGFVFLSLSQIDSLLIRILITALATAIALLALMLAWLRYVTKNGIDTL